MLKYLLILIFVLNTGFAFCQPNDTVFAVKKSGEWAIKHVLKQRETYGMLAKRYFTTITAIENFNSYDPKKKMASGSYIYIPLNAENRIIHKPALDDADLHELYYKVAEGDDIGLISMYTGVTKREMITMNNLHGNTLQINQPLLIGWIKMVPKDSLNVALGVAYPTPLKKTIKDTTEKVYFGGLDKDYNTLTNNGINVLSEKGTAVFFDKAGKSNVYCAFHNSTPYGTIIKVFNPGNNKTIFVKVLGPLPDTKQFANCIIGICSAAREDLGLTDNKAWCELSYPVN